MRDGPVSVRWALYTAAICAGVSFWGGWVSGLAVMAWLLVVAALQIIELENRLVAMTRAADRRDFELVNSLNHLDSRINGFEYDLGDKQSRMQLRISDLEEMVGESKKAMVAGQLKADGVRRDIEESIDAIKEALEAEQSRMREWICALSDRALPPRRNEQIEWWEND